MGALHADYQCFGMNYFRIMNKQIPVVVAVLSQMSMVLQTPYVIADALGLQGLNDLKV